MRKKNEWANVMYVCDEDNEQRWFKNRQNVVIYYSTFSTDIKGTDQ